MCRFLYFHLVSSSSQTSSMLILASVWFLSSNAVCHRATHQPVCLHFFLFLAIHTTMLTCFLQQCSVQKECESVTQLVQTDVCINILWCFLPPLLQGSSIFSPLSPESCCLFPHRLVSISCWHRVFMLMVSLTSVLVMLMSSFVILKSERLRSINIHLRRPLTFRVTD